MKLLLLFGALVALTVTWTLYRFYAQVQVSKVLVRAAVPYQLISTDTRVSLLVVGDSTGVGVGASRPEDSVAGRLARHIGATEVENYSVSGAIVADLPAQLAQAKHSEYLMILIQIGGNDIIRFHNSARVGQQLKEILTTLPKAKDVYLMSAGNVGGATLFPFFIRPFHTALNQKYHNVFAAVVSQAGAHYINLYKQPAVDEFALEPQKYFAIDGLHPSSEGYRVWFESLQKALSQ